MVHDKLPCISLLHYNRLLNSVLWGCSRDKILEANILGKGYSLDTLDYFIVHFKLEFRLYSRFYVLFNMIFLKKAILALTSLNRCKIQKKSFRFIIIIRVECQYRFVPSYTDILTEMPATVFTNCHVVFICNLQIIVAARIVTCYNS